MGTISTNIKDLFFNSQDFLSPGVSACQGCSAELSIRTILRVMGENSVFTVSAGCVSGMTVGLDKLSGSKIPVSISLLDNTASMASGIKRYYKKIGRDDINVLGISGDGAAGDAGFQALSGAAERNENIIFVCYDNEGYANTGFQRSGTSAQWSRTSTTPVGDVSRGKLQSKKDLPMIMAMHDVAYMATISPSYTRDFIKKLEKAKTIKDGLVYLHIFAPCTAGWSYKSNDTIEVGKMAVQTNYFPLYEYENGKFTQTVKVKEPKLVGEYTKLLKKFSHLDENQLEDLQNWVDKRFNILERLFEK